MKFVQDFLHSLLFLSFFAITAYCQSSLKYENESRHTTSIAQISEVLFTETLLMDRLNGYATRIHPTDAVIELFLTDLMIEHEKAHQNPEAYFSIPQNAYKIIRRMQNDWNHLKNYMQQYVGDEMINLMENLKNDIPSSIDMTYANLAIRRLELTYNLKIEDIANGIINGTQYDTKLSALDCFALGKGLQAEDNDYERSLEWFRTALKRFDESNAQMYSVFGLRKLHINFELKKAERMVSWGSNPIPKFMYPEEENYNLGCRGEYPKRNHKLFCLYNTTTNAFLKLAPLKMEVLQLDPFIVVFHDVIYEREIFHLKSYAYSLLELATVGDYKIDPRRVARSTGVDVENIPQSLYRRMTDITGFDIKGSNILEVLNYGMAGEYYTHTDFYHMSDEERYFSNGNRIATLLFYMSHVEKGGATVFPEEQLTVLPQKGSALLWYNMDNRGARDNRTFHGGCPILVGSKWVATQWILEYPQMFRKLC